MIANFFMGTGSISSGPLLRLNPTNCGRGGWPSMHAGPRVIFEVADNSFDAPAPGVHVVHQCGNGLVHLRVGYGNA